MGRYRREYADISYPEDCLPRGPRAYPQFPDCSNKTQGRSLEREIKAVKALETLIVEEGQNRDEIYESLFKKNGGKREKVEGASFNVFRGIIFAALDLA